MSVWINNVFKNFFNIGLYQLAGMLLQLLAIPLITRKYGLEVFGEITLTTSVAYLLGNLVNYGTNQTAIKEVAVARTDNQSLSQIFSNVFWLRFLVFLIIITITTITITTTITTSEKNVFLWLSVFPLILSEIINPLYFLIGIEKIHWISWGNLITRLLSLLLIFAIAVKYNQAVYMNLFVGVPLLLYYSFIFFYILNKFSIKLHAPEFYRFKSDITKNFYVTFNGNTALMQQSIFLIFVAGLKNPLLLGAYGIVDKLLSATRQIVSSFSMSIYPRAAELYHREKSQWKSFRNKIQNSYALFFILVAFTIYFCSHFLVSLLTKDQNEYTIGFVQLFSLAPLLLALNANNVIDLLLQNQYKSMFCISLIILLATCIFSFLLSHYYQTISLGYYPVLIEGFCLIVYSGYLNKLNLHAK